MNDIACKHGRDVTRCPECFALRVVRLEVRPVEREPYEKPEVNLVDVGNLIDGLEQDEGQLYRELNALGDRLDGFTDSLAQFEEDLHRLSELIDAAKLKLAKLEFIAEAGTAGKPAELRPDVEPPREAVAFHAGYNAPKS